MRKRAMRTRTVFVVLALVFIIGGVAGVLAVKLGNPSASSPQIKPSGAVQANSATNSSNSQPQTSPGASPPPTAVSTGNSTTATYNGTTLTCTWSTGARKPDTVVFLYNGSNSIIYVNSVTITNVGSNTAYLSGIRFQTYSSNGTQLTSTTLPVYISANIFQPNPLLVLNVGDSYSVSYSQTTLEQNPSINDVDSDAFAAFTITPIWSGNS